MAFSTIMEFTVAFIGEAHETLPIWLNQLPFEPYHTYNDPKGFFVRKYLFNSDNFGKNFLTVWDLTGFHVNDKDVLDLLRVLDAFILVAITEKGTLELLHSIRAVNHDSFGVLLYNTLNIHTEGDSLGPTDPTWVVRMAREHKLAYCPVSPSTDYRTEGPFLKIHRYLSCADYAVFLSIP